MTMRRKATGRFELPISAGQAIEFFTPEGERDWAPGWDPLYPDGAPSETPGTVFITSHGDQDTVWTIHNIDRERFAASYSRPNIGRWAGTVRVRCDDRGPQRSVITVDYDTTVLPGADPSILDHFDEASYEEMMNHWETAVTAVLPSDTT